MAPKGSGGNRYSKTMVIDSKGAVHLERELVAPAIKVTVREATDPNGEKKTGFDYLIEYQEPGSATMETASIPKGKASWFAKETEALDAARETAAQVVYASYAKVLKEGFSDMVASMRRFMGVLKDEALVRRAEVKGQKRVTYASLSGEDLVLALSVAKKYFEEIDTQASIHFRFRQSSDGHRWTKGKKADGTARDFPGKIEKVGASMVELYRELFGYSPTFVVTLCAKNWEEDKNASHRKALIHSLLSRARYDVEKKNFFLVEPVGIFASTARLFADAAHVEALEIAQAVNERLVDLEQLDLVGFELEAEGTKNNLPKVSRKPPAAKVLDAGHAASATG